jgi:anti-anti-sigma factor
VTSDVNPPTHVLSLNSGLAVGVLDRILTATEQSLDEAGATRVWAERPGQGARPGEHISPGPADARVAEGPQRRSMAASADQGGDPKRRQQERPVIGTRSMVHGLTVIGLAGDLDVATVAELRRQLVPRPSASLPDLAVDLREVAFMDCAVVGALIAARNEVADAGGCVRLAGPGIGVRRILSLCHLDEVFCIYDTLSEATEPVCARHRLP